MTDRRRRLFSETDRAELWQRWKRGESLADIARALDRSPATVHVFVASMGGVARAARRRREGTLTFEEREEISRGLSMGLSVRAVARALGRAPSTVSREVSRNRGRARYRAGAADSRAWARALRPKRCKLAEHDGLRQMVASRLELQWSPEQIAGWLRMTFPNDERMHVSHETIYRSLYIQARGVLKKELQQHLRTRRRMRRSKRLDHSTEGRGQIRDAIAISERPPEADDRAVPGHWEGDLICGSGNTCVATVVERRSRFTMLVKVDGKDSTTVVDALARHIRKLPAELRRTLTWDRGTEMAKHKDLRVATDIEVYFCDPKSPWQRGTNENTNGLVRQYLPKGTNLAHYSQADLNKIAQRLNQRPRKTLGFRTPADTFYEALP